MFNPAVQLTRKLIKLLRGPHASQHNSYKTAVQHQITSHRHAIILVNIFYVALFFLTVNAIVDSYDSWANIDAIKPLWPVKWLHLVDPVAGMTVLTLATSAIFLIGFLFTENRWLRAGMFLGFFQIIALINSFGKINHNLHGWIIVAFILIFLPHGRWSSPSKQTLSHRHSFLTIITSAQLGLLFFYSMSGLWKVAIGFYQLLQGETYHTFHPHALAQQIANRLLQTNSPSLLGDIIIENPWLGFAPYLIAVYLELFSAVVPFRPALHKLWGLAMISFHLSTWLTMSISFNTNILLLGLFLILSPRHSPTLSPTTFIQNLPLIGDTIHYLKQLKRPKNH